MIKKLIITLFIFLCSSVIYSANIPEFSAVNITSMPKVVDNINQFRANPFGYIYIYKSDYPDINDNVRKSLFDLWRSYKKKYITGGLPVLEYSNCLENIAKNNLLNIYSNMNISHENINNINNSCNMIFSGETIVAMAFQNYINPQEFYKKVVPFIIRRAIGLNDVETAPLSFPYNRAGAAVFSGSLEIEGISYNVYILDIIYGVDNINNSVFGKIVSAEENISSVSIYDINGNFVEKISIDIDGSFNTELPYEGTFIFRINFANGKSIDKIVEYEKGKMIYIDLNNN